MPTATARFGDLTCWNNAGDLCVRYRCPIDGSSDLMPIPYDGEDRATRDAWYDAADPETGRIEADDLPAQIWIPSWHGTPVDVTPDQYLAIIEGRDETLRREINARLCPAGRRECECGSSI